MGLRRVDSRDSRADLPDCGRRFGGLRVPTCRTVGVGSVGCVCRLAGLRPSARWGLRVPTRPVSRGRLAGFRVPTRRIPARRVGGSRRRTVAFPSRFAGAPTGPRPADALDEPELIGALDRPEPSGAFDGPEPTRALAASDLSDALDGLARVRPIRRSGQTRSVRAAWRTRRARRPRVAPLRRIGAAAPAERAACDRVARPSRRRERLVQRSVADLARRSPPYRSSPRPGDPPVPVQSPARTTGGSPAPTPTETEYPPRPRPGVRPHLTPVGQALPPSPAPSPPRPRHPVRAPAHRSRTCRRTEHCELQYSWFL